MQAPPCPVCSGRASMPSGMGTFPAAARESLVRAPAGARLLSQETRAVTEVFLAW